MPTPDYPLNPGLHYSLPAESDTGVGYDSQWAVLRTTPEHFVQFVLATAEDPKGHEVTWDGNNLHVKLSTAHWFPGNVGAIVFVTSPGQILRLYFTIEYPAITATEIDKYKSSFTLSDIPSAELLATVVAVGWQRRYHPLATYPPADIGTGTTIEHDFPEPSVALYGSSFPAYTVTATITQPGGGSFSISSGVNIQEQMSSRDCVVDAAKGAVVRFFNSSAGTSSNQANAFLATMDGETFAAFLRSQPFAFYKNPCAWMAGAEIFISVQAWDYRTFSPLSQVELWRSRDFLRTKELVAVIWENAQWWGAQTFKLEPYGAISPAMKRNTSPSEVWVKVSLDRVTWDEGEACYLVHVGNLPSSSKEPLSIIQRDNGIELHNAASNWRRWSTDFGKTWEVLAG